MRKHPEWEALHAALTEAGISHSLPNAKLMFVSVHDFGIIRLHLGRWRTTKWGVPEVSYTSEPSKVRGLPGVMFPHLVQRRGQLAFGFLETA